MRRIVVRSCHRSSAVGWLVVAAIALTAVALHAETGAIRIGEQFGLGYLPLTIMRHEQLLERAAARAGLPDVKVGWVQMGAGSAMNDALLSATLDVASGGVGPLVTSWHKTKGRQGIMGVSALASMPEYLNTIRPEIRSLNDFTDADRIALPAVKVSGHAIILQMAAEQLFGPGEHARLDRLTVSMSHPDGMTAMLSGRSEIIAHFTSAPFMYQELADPRVHRVVNSYDVFGGPATYTVLWSTRKFHDENPMLYGALIAALSDAMAFIGRDTRRVAEIYVASEKSRTPLDLIAKIIADPENVYTTAPQNIMRFVEFMHRTGVVGSKPADWRELFFPEIHSLSGS
jgi:NitT/TauT family transport system substrate-binding protein